MTINTCKTASNSKSQNLQLHCSFLWGQNTTEQRLFTEWRSLACRMGLSAASLL